MSTYQEASRLKSLLRSIVKEELENNQTIKSCIKAQKAVVWAKPDTTNKTVKVKFLPDIMTENEPLELPYNPQMESYLTSATVQQSAVSVWYYQSISNGIVMQDGSWSVVGGGNDLIDLIYPVGSIYMSVNNTSPQTLFGGTWEKIEGRFLLGSSSSYANGSSGGSETVTLTVREMPVHNHNIIEPASGGSVTVNVEHPATSAGESSLTVGDKAWTDPTFTEGGGQPHNNMPPYLAVNIWKRTA